MPTPRFRRPARFFILSAFAFLLSVASGHAGFYWDADGDPTGNDIVTGANLGGSGTWDVTLVNWHEHDTDPGTNTVSQETAWNNAGTNDAFFRGTAGTVTLGADVVARTLTFNTPGYIITNGVITLSTNGTGTIAGTNATIYSEIAGTVGINKPNAGTLTLAGSNSFSGIVTVHAGALAVPNSFALGTPLDGVILENTNTAGGNGTTLNLSAGVTINGESLTLTSRTNGLHRTSLINSNNTNTWNGPVILTGDNLTQFSSAANSLLIVNGNISGGCDAFAIRGGGNGIINGQINIGATRLTKTDGGLWTINSSSNVFGLLTLAVGTVRLGANNTLPANVAIAFGQPGSPSSGTLDLAGFNQEVAALSVTRLPNSQIITNSSTNFDSMLIFNGTNDSFFTGIIKDGARKVALIINSGSLTVTNNHTYSGGTVVNGGTLFVNNPIGNGLGFGNLTVNAAGTVGGTGIIGGPAVCAGTLAPGSNSVGILTFTNNLEMSAGTYAWDLISLNDNSSGTAGTDFDRVNVSNGILQLGGTSKISINFAGSASAPDATNAFWQSPRAWTIINLTGTGTNVGASNFASVLNGNYPAGSFSTTATETNVTLRFTPSVVSQPGFAGLILNGTNVVLSVTNLAQGRSYEVQFKTNLNDAVWATLTNAVAGSGTNSITTDTATDAQRFFRIVVP